MGMESKCTARISGKQYTGKLQLEVETLMFRAPDQRIKFPLSQIKRTQAVDGCLMVHAGRATYEFEVGPSAERWATNISNPKSLIEKLGIKEGADVVLLNGVDDSLASDIKRVGAKTSTRRAGRDRDWIVLGVERPVELTLLRGLDALIKPNGGIWVIFPKQTPGLKAENLIAAAKANGLVDTKIARVSERLTAMKFVIPVARRK